jgi:acetone carboxylase gamma subunit
MQNLFIILLDSIIIETTTKYGGLTTSCAAQLEVESVMPHYPFAFNFLPDFEAWGKRLRE